MVLRGAVRYGELRVGMVRQAWPKKSNKEQGVQNGLSVESGSKNQG